MTSPSAVNAASSPARVRPVVLALAPAAPGISRGTATPSLELLGGSRLIQRLLGTLQAVGLPAPLVVAAPEAVAQLRRVLGPRVRVLSSPADRRSALTGALAECDEELLLVHDAERALTPASVIAEVLAALRDDVDAVVPVIALTDSVKEVRPDGLRNIDRNTLAGLQSPRLMRRSLLDALLAAPVSAASLPLPHSSAERPERGPQFDEMLAALESGARVRTVHGSHSGFAMLDRLSLWQAQISLGLARDTSHRHGLAQR